MILENIAEFADQLPPMRALIGLDLGEKTIGVAVSGLAFSLFTPMAYCRYGCPTGALLKFLTFGSRYFQVVYSSSLAPQRTRRAEDELWQH